MRAMRGLPLLIAITAGAAPFMDAAGQAPAAPTLSAAVRAHLTDDRFQVVTSMRGLPLGVREKLQEMFGAGMLDIADPGAPFRATDVVMDPKLPVRRLGAAACSMDHCLVYYERGGIAHTWHLALLHWTPEETRLEAGGTAPGGLKSIEALRNTVLSGGFKHSTSW